MQRAANQLHPAAPPAGRVPRAQFLAGRRGFTILELQVAVLLLALAVTVLASLMTTQYRVLQRLQGNFKPAATLMVTRSNDPWVRKLNTPARITPDPLSLPAAPTVAAGNTVEIVSQSQNMIDQNISVTVDVTEIP